MSPILEAFLAGVAVASGALVLLSRWAARRQQSALERAAVAQKLEAPATPPKPRTRAGKKRAAKAFSHVYLDQLLEIGDRDEKVLELLERIVAPGAQLEKLVPKAKEILSSWRIQ